MLPQPFKIAVPDSVLADLRYRLEHARYATDFANDDWSYGFNGDYLRDLVDYWLSGYDWRAQEARMNEFSHFRTEVDGVPVHFIREPGKGPKPLPLIMSHGWPWSFWDFEKVIRPLADPGSFGGDPADAFEVIATSMIGFGFSSPLTTPGISAFGVADYWHKLMTEQLGFDRYGAQGGDWGGMATCQLGHKYAGPVVGIHTTLLPDMAHWGSQRPWDVTRGMLIPDDWPAAQRDAALATQKKIAAHVAVHVLAPQTMGFALNDSPIGLLSWILERRRAWSGCEGDLERIFSKDDLLNLIMIYWVTGTVGTSMRIYAEAGRHPWTPSHDRTPIIEAPVGLSYFGQDIVQGQEANEWQANVHYKKQHATGGHFAPAESPDALVEDIRATFRDLR